LEQTAGKRERNKCAHLSQMQNLFLTFFNRSGEEAEYAPLPTGPGAEANKKTLSSDEAVNI
jgi:hypothetical protein